MEGSQNPCLGRAQVNASFFEDSGEGGGDNSEPEEAHGLHPAISASTSLAATSVVENVGAGAPRDWGWQCEDLTLQTPF